MVDLRAILIALILLHSIVPTQGSDSAMEFRYEVISVSNAISARSMQMPIFFLSNDSIIRFSNVTLLSPSGGSKSLSNQITLGNRL